MCDGSDHRRTFSEVSISTLGRGRHDRHASAYVAEHALEAANLPLACGIATAAEDEPATRPGAQEGQCRATHPLARGARAASRIRVEQAHRCAVEWRDPVPRRRRYTRCSIVSGSAAGSKGAGSRRPAAARRRYYRLAEGPPRCSRPSSIGTGVSSSKPSRACTGWSMPDEVQDVTRRDWAAEITRRLWPGCGSGRRIGGARRRARGASRGPAYMAPRPRTS